MSKIAKFCSKYSNKNTAKGYKNGIESFLRCMNQLPKKDNTGKKITYDYETLFEQYLKVKKRDHDADFVTFANCLKVDAASAQSARQIMTYARYVLTAHGVKLGNVVIQDLKREMKGGAGTVDRVMTVKVIDTALKEMDIRGRAVILTLASSGMRLNEALSLTLSDVDFESNPLKIVIRGAISKTKQTRYTFISDEAAQCVRAWLKKKDEYIKTSSTRNKGLIEAGKSKPKSTDSNLIFPFSDNNANVIWENALKASGQFSQDEQTGRNQYRIHSFRKFFISQLSMAGQKVLAEHLAGHQGYLDSSYRQVDSEQAGREYLKVMHVVTIGATQEFKEKAIELNGKLQMQGESIEGLRAINDKLQRQIEQMGEQLAEMKAFMNKWNGLLKQPGMSDQDYLNNIREHGYEIKQTDKSIHLHKK